MYHRTNNVSHLLHMDDTKPYARNDQVIDSLIHIPRIYSRDIGMSFGRDECGRMVPKRVKVMRTEGVEPEGTITDVQDSYEYLGIPQANRNHKEATRKSATTKIPT